MMSDMDQREAPLREVLTPPWSLSMSLGRAFLLCATAVWLLGACAQDEKETLTVGFLQAWGGATAPGQVNGPSDVALDGAGNVYVAGGSGSPVDVLRYDGINWSVWSQLNAARLFGLWGTGADDIWSVGWCQNLWHFDGLTWTQTGCQGALIGTGIWGSSSTNVWMVGSMNALYSEPFFPAGLDAGAIFLHYDGLNWNPVVSGFNVDFWDIWGTPSGRLYAVGEYGAIIRYGSAPQAANLNLSVWGLIALVLVLALVASLGVGRMMAQRY